MISRFLALFLAGTCLNAHASCFRVGAAQVEITPRNGTPMGGYYKFRAVSGVLDPLFVKTIVVEQDGTHAAFVVLDLSGTTRTLVEAARKAIQDQCGIEGDHVMISATHTHTGPQLPRGTLMDVITKVNLPEGVAFVNGLPTLIAQSVSEAKGKLAPANPAFTIGDGKGISFNRRVLRDGVVQAIWQPQKIDLTKERPAGPVDPDVGVLVFDSPESKPIATYLNFAMHPTAVGGGLKISADYPGVFTRLVSERKGGFALFTNGCCGNINHTDYMTGEKRGHVKLGTMLADAATNAWPSLKPLRTNRPRVRSEMITLQRRQLTDADVARAKDVVSRMMTENLGTVTMADAVCVMETMAKKEVPLTVEVQVISLSDDLAIVSMPGEIFVELGLAIKKASPFKHTLIAELANGSMGYVPNKDAYPQGNYEVVSARGAPGSGEKLVEVALKLLGELKSDK